MASEPNGALAAGERQAELGELLGKERSEEQRRLVNEIIASDTTVADKIARIERLDRDAAGGAAARSGVADAIEGGVDLAPSRVRPLQVSYAELGSLLMAEMSSASYLAFLFRDLSKIAVFGARTGAVSTTWFLPGARLARTARTALTDVLAPAASQAAQRCQAVLEDGWRFLDRYQYNLFVVVHRMFDKLSGLRPRGISGSDRALHEQLQSVHYLYVLLRSEPGYVTAILAALALLEEKAPAQADDWRGIAAVLQVVLAGDGPPPTLGAILVGLQMVRYRRFLTEGQLVRPRPGDLVNRNKYACTDAIREKIETALVESRQRIDRLVQERRALTRAADFVPMDEGAISFDLLARLFERQTQQPLAADPDLMVTLPLLVNAFDGVLRPFLSERVALTGGNSVRLPLEASVAPVFARMHAVVERAIGPDRYPHPVSRTLFAQARHAESGEPLPAELRNAIAELAELLAELGGQIESLSTSRRFARELQAAPGLATLYVESASVLSGRPVLEAVEAAISLCYLAAAFLDHPRFAALPARYAAVEAELAAHRELLARMEAPPAASKAATGAEGAAAGAEGAEPGAESAAAGAEGAEPGGESAAAGAEGAEPGAESAAAGAEGGVRVAGTLRNHTEGADVASGGPGATSGSDVAG